MQEAVVTIASAGELAALKAEIEGLREVVSSKPPKQAAEHIATLLPRIGAVKGARGIRSEVSKVRRALKSRSPNKARALVQLEVAMKSFNQELAWRQRAVATILPGLQTYEMSIRDTIGLRMQPKLPTEQAVEIAGCMAYHRDISLQF